jgi:hypothetical protein
MPANDPIPRLLRILSGELSQEKLESLGREFDALAQDRSETLVFFVLQNVCQRLASALESEAVSLERFQELTADISKEIEDVLHDVQRDESALDSLEQLVTTLFRNLGVYRH